MDSCQSETALCLGVEDTINSFELAVADWHSSCDTYLSASLTTPVLSALSSTRVGLADPAYCDAVQSTCLIEHQIGARCSTQHPGFFSESVALQGFSSCFCQPSIIPIASVCEYDGNVTCLRTSAALSNMYAWKMCPVV